MKKFKIGDRVLYLGKYKGTLVKSDSSYSNLLIRFDKSSEFQGWTATVLEHTNNKKSKSNFFYVSEREIRRLKNGS